MRDVYCRGKTHVNEGVHDGHGLGGDTGIRVHLFEDLVDVDLVGLGLLVIKGGRKEG